MPSEQPTGLMVTLDSDRVGGIERFRDGIVSSTHEVITWTEARAPRLSRALPLRSFVRALSRGMTVKLTPDVIVVDRLHVMPTALVARLMSWPARPTLVLLCHGSEIASRSKRRFKSWALGKADLVVVPSAWTAKQLAEAFPSVRRIRVLHPGIYTERRAPPEAFERDRVRAGHGLPVNGPLLLTVARLDPNARHKGVDRTISALSILRDRGLVAHYAIVGDGPDRDRLSRLVNDLGLTEWVTFAPDLTDEQVADLMWASDVFALPTLPMKAGRQTQAEGFGIVLLEAAAAGLPVVSTGAGGAADAFRAGVTGVKVSGDPDSIAMAVGGLLSGSIAYDAAMSRDWASSFDWRSRRAEFLGILLGTDEWDDEEYQ